MATRTCWYCEHSAHMTRLHDPVSSRPAAEGQTRYQAAFKCDECRTISIGETYSGQQVAGTQLDARELTWWPKLVEGQQIDDVPGHIAAAAEEAHRCFSIDAYRATASLARSVVEATAKEKGITTGTLYAKIEALHAADHIRGLIKEAAHEIRHLGNDMAHGDFVESITREEAQEVLELMSDVLDEVFQTPARIEARKAARVRKSGA